MDAPLISVFVSQERRASCEWRHNPLINSARRVLKCNRFGNPKKAPKISTVCFDSAGVTHSITEYLGCVYLGHVQCLHRCHTEEEEEEKEEEEEEEEEGKKEKRKKKRSRNQNAISSQRFIFQVSFYFLNTYLDFLNAGIFHFLLDFFFYLASYCYFLGFNLEKSMANSTFLSLFSFYSVAFLFRFDFSILSHCWMMMELVCAQRSSSEIIPENMADDTTFTSRKQRKKRKKQIRTKRNRADLHYLTHQSGFHSLFNSLTRGGGGGAFIYVYIHIFIYLYMRLTMS